MLSRIGLFVGGVVVVALFAALLAPLFVDWTSFRQDFEREASRIMGRPVTVHGSVDARLIPFPSVTLNDVRVGSPDELGAAIARGIARGAPLLIDCPVGQFPDPWSLVTLPPIRPRKS